MRTELWSEHERLALMAEATICLRQRMRNGRGLSGDKLYAILETMGMVASAPAPFLEANRQQIVNDIRSLQEA